MADNPVHYDVRRSVKDSTLHCARESDGERRRMVERPGARYSLTWESAGAAGPMSAAQPVTNSPLRRRNPFALAPITLARSPTRSFLEAGSAAGRRDPQHRD